MKYLLTRADSCETMRHIKNLSIQQTVINTIETWEQSESFLFTRGYKKEARVIRDSIPLLIEGLQMIQGEDTLGDLRTISSMQRMIANGNDLLLSVMQLEVQKTL